ncbi:MAG: response regulator transcription factor [Planctomycetota bacterium]
MSREKILVVEDDEDIHELVGYNLSKDGYRVLNATTGEDGIEIARLQVPALVVLDLMLPELDGLEVCRILKSDAKTQGIAIVMLTAKGEEPDIVAGLELGADDYVTKPFSPRVLLARIRAVLRRKAREPVREDSPLRVHDVIIHPGRHEVTVSGKPVDLTSTEFRVLHLLARRPGWVFTRSRIVSAVHGDDYPVTDRSVDVQIAGLRKKLGDAGECVETVRGVGYRFRE